MTPNRAQEYARRSQEAGYFFQDGEDGFRLNLAGFFSFQGGQTARRLDSFWQSAQRDLAALEKGEIVNKTAHPTESENRAVDHFNLRLPRDQSPPEMVEAGKTLEDSLEKWEKNKADLRSFLSARPEIKNIVFNGIGGSYLGPYLTLVFARGEHFNLNPGNRPRIFFLANTDPDSFGRLFAETCALKETLMVHISKSGSTAETRGNLEAFQELLAGANLPAGPHNAAVTTPGSAFDEYAREKEFAHTWYMNEETGGRTSVGSAVGMVPAAVAGLDFAEFLRGQSHMDSLTRREDWRQNPAALITMAIYQLLQTHGPRNMILLGYSDSLKEYAHYCQQLYMESLGKNYTRENQKVRAGLTTFGGVGTGEQHAFMQQVQKGIQDCFVRFYSFRARRHDYSNPAGGVSMGNLLTGFRAGTQAALLQNNVDFLDLELPEATLFHLGQMIALEERVVQFLASFFDINAFDQPGVQDGKLAQKRHGQLRAQLIEALTAKKAPLPLEGPALEICRRLNLAENDLLLLETLLSDWEANQDNLVSWGELSREGGLAIQAVTGGDGRTQYRIFQN